MVFLCLCMELVASITSGSSSVCIYMHGDYFCMLGLDPSGGHGSKTFSHCLLWKYDYEFYTYIELYWNAWFASGSSFNSSSDLTS
mmetsp:Transcript_21690/g.38146  ORF Transcript_21690/g.38146 Transcript_21690/m.38146 type:complete len:85 (+) Transcript_21690:237-491(+)